MSLRAVVVPATPLLVPGAAGAAVVLGRTRRLVREALTELVDAAPDGELAVLAHGDGAVGHLRPSLRGAGISDAWVPALAAWRPGAWPGAWPGAAGVARVPASVALLCLSEALAERRCPERLADVVVHEVGADGADHAATVERLRASAAIVVAGGGVPAGQDSRPDALAPAVAAVLDAVRVAERWEAEVREAAEDHEHLPPAYRVTLLRAPDDVRWAP